LNQLNTCGLYHRRHTRFGGPRRPHLQLRLPGHTPWATPKNTNPEETEVAPRLGSSSKCLLVKQHARVRAFTALIFWPSQLPTGNQEDEHIIKMANTNVWCISVYLSPSWKKNVCVCVFARIEDDMNTLVGSCDIELPLRF
jgi:hypothetical protein